MLIVKLAPSGDTLWTRIIGGSDYDAAIGVTPDVDGGYTFTGRTVSFGVAARDVAIFKTSVSGNLLWFKTYGGIYHDEGNFVQQTSDSGYILCGHTGSFGYDVYEDGMVVKTKSNGDADSLITYTTVYP